MKCLNKQIAEDQRRSELRDYGHDRGCFGYKQVGCYDCLGDNRLCDHYLDWEMINETQPRMREQKT